MSQLNPEPLPVNSVPPTSTNLLTSSSRNRALKWMLATVAILFALLLGLLTLLVLGLLLDLKTGPVPLLVGLILATLPAPIYILLIVWIDRYESEPPWMLATAFFWGATIAALYSLSINTIVGRSVDQILTGKGDPVGAVISAPIVEEGSKALVLFILYFWKKDEFDGVVDGLVYAGMVALGFAMTENILYYGRAYRDGGGVGVSATFLGRGLMTPFAHPFFTSMTGIGLGLARQSSNLAVKFIMPLLGLGLAMLLHAMWNLSVELKLHSIVYILVMVPIAVVTLGSIFFALSREGRVVREHLLCDYQSNLLTEEEYNRLCDISGRMGASFNALTRGGIGAWRARMQWNQMASELAFHRSRVARGIVGRDQAAAEREAAYLQRLRELRARFNPS